MNPPTKDDITGVVLCGGAGQRMGGADKGLLTYRDKALVDIAIDRLSPQVGSIIISANRHLDQYAIRGCPVIVDDGRDASAPAFHGPLAGFSACLRAARTQWVLFVPCDSPRFPRDLAAQLTAGLQKSDQENGSQEAVFMQGHPVFALLSTNVLPSLRQYLNSGQRRLGDWLHSIQARPVVPTHADDFQNLNTPGDLSPDTDPKT
jgi:molybdenum cofactor guanylyltransferase